MVQQRERKASRNDIMLKKESNDMKNHSKRGRSYSDCVKTPKGCHTGKGGEELQ